MSELEAIIAAGPQHPQYAFVTGTSTMADKIEDGGPAYPRPEVWKPDGTLCALALDGMSLRDYFAAAALTGMMAYGMTEKLDPDELAHDAYCTADAMLSARKKGGE